jgi:hypothetical protein
MFFKWLPKRSGPAALPPDPEQNTPAAELESFGPVARANHIAYVPSKAWAGVPGVGTGNLAFVPDFMVSAPQGLGMLRPQGWGILNRPAVITRPKQTIEGLGGIVAGQIVHQPLLEIDIQNGLSGVGSE